MPNINQYTAKEIQVLEGLEPVRKRPGMFVGSTDGRGLHECLREIVDNSVDESFAQVAKNIWVILAKDGSATVRDDGRGMPVDKHATGISALELTMTKLHAGGKFGGGAYKVSGGLHGVGASMVNALSSYFRVIVLRNNKAYFQEYKEGKPLKEVSNALQAQLDKWLQQKGGIKSLVAHSNRDKDSISDVIYFKKEETDITAEVAIQYTNTYSESVKGFVNGINTVDGGTHLTGFIIALTRSVW